MPTLEEALLVEAGRLGPDWRVEWTQEEEPLYSHLHTFNPHVFPRTRGRIRTYITLTYTPTGANAREEIVPSHLSDDDIEAWARGVVAYLYGRISARDSLPPMQWVCNEDLPHGRMAILPPPPRDTAREALDAANRRIAETVLMSTAIFAEEPEEPVQYRTKWEMLFDDV